MQELGKIYSKIHVTPNGLEKYMSFILGNKLIFIDRFHYLSYSSHSLSKNLCEHDFRQLSQKFHSEVLDLDKQNVLDVKDLDVIPMSPSVILKSLTKYY